ncbi:MAG: Tfx family DNA-binding protein [Methanobacteriota archaeon]
MIDTNKTHLTQKQFEILKMKIAGKSLSEIAKELQTSRANISSIAKTAEENVKKSKNTLKLVELINWSIKIDVRAGSNVYEISEKVFREADRKKIKISHNYSELVRLITGALGTKRLKRRKALKNFSIVVSKDGRFDIF